MAGAISVTGPPKAKATPTWAGNMRRCSSTCCAGRVSHSRTRGRCFQIRPARCASSPIRPACASASAGSNATAVWAAKLGVNLQSSTLKDDETGEPFHVQQAGQIRAFRAAWTEAGHTREPRASVSRSIIALTDDRDRTYFGRGREDEDQVGHIDEST